MLVVQVNLHLPRQTGSPRGQTRAWTSRNPASDWPRRTELNPDPEALERIRGWVGSQPCSGLLSEGSLWKREARWRLPASRPHTCRPAFS